MAENEKPMSLDEIDELVNRRMPEYVKECKAAITHGNTVVCLFIQDFNREGGNRLMEAAIRYACIHNVPVIMTPKLTNQTTPTSPAKWTDIMPCRMVG